MPSYIDNKGRIITLRPITVATLMKARSDGFAWFARIEELDATLLDPVRLCEACAICTGLTVDEIAAGLSGDALETAQDAVVEALADFYPARISRAIRAGIKSMRERIDQAIEPAATSED